MLVLVLMLSACALTLHAYIERNFAQFVFAQAAFLFLILLYKNDGLMLASKTAELDQAVQDFSATDYSLLTISVFLGILSIFL
ncbi:MAG: hypothetical protein AAF098_18225 [Pseudomonadota bacterium]